MHCVQSLTRLAHAGSHIFKEIPTSKKIMYSDHQSISDFLCKPSRIQATATRMQKDQHNANIITTKSHHQKQSPAPPSSYPPKSLPSKTAAFFHHRATSIHHTGVMSVQN
jgi:hypothetical protein